MSRRTYNPGVFAPLYIFIGLVAFVAFLTRMPGIGPRLDVDIHTLLLVAHGPLLLTAIFFESQFDYGNTINQARWLRIAVVPVRIGYVWIILSLLVRILQRYELSLVGFEVSPPFDQSTWEQIAPFATFAAAVGFGFYYIGSIVIIPLLRVLALPFRALPTVLAVPALVLVGTAGGASLAAFLSKQRTFEGIMQLIAGPADVVPLAVIGAVFVVIPWAIGLSIQANES